VDVFWSTGEDGTVRAWRPTSLISNKTKEPEEDLEEEPVKKVGKIQTGKKNKTGGKPY